MPTVISNGSTGKLVLYVVLSTDHLSPATGKTVAVTISKNGASFANPSAGATNATEIGSGWYYFTPSATDTGTNGPLIVLGTCSGCDNSTRDYLIADAPLTAAQIATGVWQDSTSGDFTASNSIGKALYTTAAPGASGGYPVIGSAPFPASGTISAATWDEVNTGATHNVNNSTGKQLRSVSSNTAAIYPTSGTVNLTAATSTTATLDALASNVAQAYQWDVINILSGTGAGQSRAITNYTTGRVATVSPAWSTTPDTSSTFDITPTAQVQVLSYIAGQDPATLVLDVAASAHDTAGTIGAAINASGGGGTVDANIVSINSVSASGVTTIGANVGTTQPVNFQGTGASAMVKSDVEQIKGVNSVGTAGYVGLDWGQVTNKTTTNALTGTTISTSQAIASVTGAVGSVTGSVGSVAGDVGGNVVGSVGSVTGSVGSVTGSVGSVTGSVGSVTGNVGGNVTGSVGSLATQAKADVTAAVLDVAIASHETSGTVGQAIAQSASAGDPLATAVPGSYVAGTAGYILGTYLDAAITSRLAPTAAGRTLDVSTGGEAGLDWSNIGSPTSTVNLSNTTISTVQDVRDVTGSVGSVTAGVTFDLTAAVPATGNAANSVGDCLNAARAMGFGNWVIDQVAKTLTLYSGSGEVVHAFTLDDVASPLTRTTV